MCFCSRPTPSHWIGNFQIAPAIAPVRLAVFSLEASGFVGWFPWKIAMGFPWNRTPTSDPGSTWSRQEIRRALASTWNTNNSCSDSLDLDWAQAPSKIGHGLPKNKRTTGIAVPWKKTWLPRFPNWWRLLSWSWPNCTENIQQLENWDLNPYKIYEFGTCAWRNIVKNGML